MSAVAIGYLSDGNTKDNFTFSLCRAMLYETGRTGAPPHLLRQRSNTDLARGRNTVVKGFLNDTDARWLLFIDSDMGFPPDAIERLLDAADPHTAPIVGALCFGLRRQATDMDTVAERFRCFPTIYAWVERDDEVGFQVVTDYPRDTVTLTSATGAAFLLIHRTALKRMRAKHGDEWFSEVTHPKGSTRFSEDMSFCVRAQGCGYPIHVHTGVKTSHDKGGVVLTEETWDAQQALTALDKKPEVAA